MQKTKGNTCSYYAHKGTNQLRSIVTEAKRRFGLFAEGGVDALHPNLRSSVFRVVVSTGGRKEYETLQKEFEKITSVDGKEIILQSLGQTTESELAKEYLDFLFSPEVAIQDVHSGASSLAANPKVRYTLWKYIQTNWDAMVCPKLSSNVVVLDRFLRLTLTTFTKEDIAQEINTFFKEKDNTGYDRALGVVADSIRSNAAYRERDSGILGEWLSAHGYL